MKKSFLKILISQKPLLLLRTSLFILIIGIAGVGSAFAQLTITPVTWNVIGLDSNKVTVGPNVFPVGARICNTGGAAVNNIITKFVWDSTNSYITLDASTTDTQTLTTLATGVCTDFYFDVFVTRSDQAYNQTRRYRITTIGDGTSLVSTPSPRELYVEKLVSQSRNSVNSVVGPTTVYVGGTYNYTINASTAPGGYEQLEAFLSLSNVIFRITAISTTYTEPTGATNNKFYADACGWQNNPSSLNYRSCVGPTNYSGGKAGGDISTTYTVKVLSTGSTTASTMIYDFSGSSYHYNADYGQKGLISITALPPPAPQIGLNKSVLPSGTQIPGTDLTYTISFTNTGNATASNLILTDPDPVSSGLKLNTNTDFKVGSIVNTLGTSGLTTVVSYSKDNGTTYAYTPVSAGGGAPAGYDRNVTHIRWTFSGTLSQTSPNNTGSVSFSVRIQ